MGKVVYGLSGESNEYAFRLEVAEASPSSSVHLFLQRLGSACSWTTCFSIATLTNTLVRYDVKHTRETCDVYIAFDSAAESQGV